MGQRQLGHRVRVAAILDAPEGAGAFRGRLDAGAVEVIPLVLPGRAYLRERASVHRLCGEARPDVVHTHGYRPDIVDGQVARSLGIPTVTTVHGFTGGGVRNRCYEWAQQRSFRSFEAVVAVSRPLVQRLAGAGVSPDRIHLVPNAYEGDAPHARAEARRLLGIPADAFVAGWVGRLTREKGADTMLDALASPDMPEELLLGIAGDGAERPALEARARENGAAGRIRWFGMVPDAARIYSAFDVFVLSSRTEGTPIALFEAMAAGVPIVATRVGGVPDVVSQDDALLVPSENPAALAAAIRSVREHPVAATRRAQAAARRLRAQFGLAGWLARYEEIYRNLSSIPLSRRTA